MRILKENGLCRHYENENFIVLRANREKLTEKKLTEVIFKEEESTKIKGFDMRLPYQISIEKSQDKDDFYFIYKTSFISSIFNSEFKKYFKKKPNENLIRENNKKEEEEVIKNEIEKEKQRLKEDYWKAKPKNIYIKAIIHSLIRKELCLIHKNCELNDIITTISKKMLCKIKGYDKNDIEQSFSEKEVLEMFNETEKGKKGDVILEEVVSYSLKKGKVIKDKENDIVANKLTKIISEIIRAKKKNTKFKKYDFFKSKVEKQKNNIINSIYEKSSNNKDKMKAKEYWDKKKDNIEALLINVENKVKKYLDYVPELKLKDANYKETLGKLFKYYATLYRTIKSKESSNMKEEIFLNNLVYEGIKKCYIKSKDKKIINRENWNEKENILLFVKHNIRNKYMSYNLSIGKTFHLSRLDSVSKIKLQVEDGLQEKINNSIIFATYHFSKMLDINPSIDIIGTNQEEEFNKKRVRYIENFRFQYSNIIGYFYSIETSNSGQLYSELLSEQLKSLKKFRNKTFHGKCEIFKKDSNPNEKTLNLCMEIIKNYSILKMKQLNSNNLIYISDQTQLKELFATINYTLDAKNNYFLSFNNLVTDKKLLLKMIKNINFDKKNFASFFKLTDEEIKKCDLKTENDKKINAYKFILRELYTEKFLALAENELEKKYQGALNKLKNESENIEGNHRAVYKFKLFCTKFRNIELKNLKIEIQKEISLLKNNLDILEEDKLRKIKALEKFEKHLMGEAFIDFINTSEIGEKSLFKNNNINMDQKEEINFNINLNISKEEIKNMDLDWFNLGLYLDKRRRNQLIGAINNFKVKVIENNNKQKIENAIKTLKLVSLIPEIDYVQSEKYKNESKVEIQLLIPNIEEFDKIFKEKYNEVIELISKEKDEKINERKTFYLDDSQERNLVLLNSFERIRKYKFHEIYKDKFFITESYINKYCELYKKIKLETTDNWQQLAEEKQQFNNFSNIIYLDVLVEIMDIINDIVEKFLSWTRKLEININYLLSVKNNKKNKDRLENVLKNEENIIFLESRIKYIHLFTKLRDDFSHLTILRKSNWNERHNPKEKETINNELKKLYEEKGYIFSDNPIQLIFSSEESISIFEILTLLVTYDLKQRKGMYDSIKHIFDKRGYYINFKTLKNGRVIFESLKSKSYKVLKSKDNPKGESTKIQINNNEKVEIVRQLLDLTAYEM